MASYLLSAILALSLARLAASQDQQTTWGSVIFAMYGERTPLDSPYEPMLTPLGAQQGLSAGSVIRSRYIQGPATNVTSSFPIYNIYENTISNRQLELLATDDAWVAASAQAFMQGVYPPLGAPHVDDQSMLSNGTLVQYPLNGYQYPTLEIISPSDFNYIG